MSRRTTLPQSRRHIWVFDEDWEYLDKALGATSPSRMGIGPGIRNIIHLYVTNLKAQENEKLDAARKRTQVPSI